MTSWHSYPSSFNLGHRVVVDILKDPVLVEEKVDGSQFSFGVFPSDDDPEHICELRCRSKGQQIVVDAPDKMFEKAVDTALSLMGDLRLGWTYSGEYLQKPKHNVLAYDRVPAKNIIIFDIRRGEEDYLSRYEKEKECERLGLEIVPVIFEGIVEDIEFFRSLLERTSILGGQKIEGVFIKNYARFNPDKKAMMAKFVSEAFKEIHQGEWKSANPGFTETVDMIGNTLRTPARWNKAIQHLREQGRIEDSPRDIGNVIKEIQSDVLKECEAEIAERLMAYALPKIRRRIVAGFPEWYKDELLKKQFAANEELERGEIIADAVDSGRLGPHEIPQQEAA